MNSENSKMSKPHVLKLKLTSELGLRIGENVPHLEIAEVVLVHCNMVINHYQQDTRVLYTFVPNKPFGSL